MKLGEHLAWFLVAALLTAFVSALIRLESPRRIVRDTVHFFTTIALFVLAFCVVVYLLEWIFIRPLI